jgi:hypothetical protein
LWCTLTGFVLNIAYIAFPTQAAVFGLQDYLAPPAYNFKKITAIPHNIVVECRPEFAIP